MHGTHNDKNLLRRKLNQHGVDANAGKNSAGVARCDPCCSQRHHTKGSQVSQGTELKQVNSSGLTQKRAEGNQV